MQPALALALGLLLAAVIVISTFANPIGWFVAALFGISGAIAAAGSVSWRRSDE